MASAISANATAGNGTTELGSDGNATRSGQPVAMYKRPAGTYLFGLGLSTSMTRGYFVPAYTEMTFRNFSENAASSRWISSTGGVDYIDSNEENASAILNPSVIPTPTLTVRGNDGQRASYTYGKMTADDPKQGLIAAGGWNEAINVDRVGYQISTLTMPGDKKNYVFGTCKNVNVVSISNYFEKPLQKAIVRSVYITFGKNCLDIDTAALRASADTLLRLNAIKVERTGDKILRKETIATAETSVFDVLDLTFTTGFQCYYLNFRFKEPLVVDYEMLYELDGFASKEGLSFGIQSNSKSDPYEQNAFIRIKDSEGNTEDLVSSEYTKRLTGTTAFRASLMFGLDMMFPYFHPTTSNVHCSLNGGTAFIDFQTSYAENTPNPIDTYPFSISIDNSWAKIKNIEYDKDNHNRTVEIAYEPLPENVSERSATMTVKAFGLEDQKINITQGNAGINILTHNKISVTNREGSWTVVCPEDCREITLIGSDGSVIERIAVTSGETTICNSSLCNGIYTLVFDLYNDHFQSIKVIK